MGRVIPESEYRADFERVRHELARLIAHSGLTLAEIAKGTRLKWDTVYAASQGRAVRMENAARIRYYLNCKSKYHEENQANHPCGEARPQ